MSEIPRSDFAPTSEAQVSLSRSFNGNKTYGRIKSITSQYAPEIVELIPPATRLQRLQHQYSEHKTGKVSLAPQESIALRREIDKLSSIVHPGIPNAWGDYSPEEKAYLAEQENEKRKFANSLGMMIGGPVMSTLPAIARFLGAPEETVEKLAVVNSDLAGVGIFGGKREFGNAELASRVPSGRWPSPSGTKTGSGTFVQQVKQVKPPPDGYKTYKTYGIKADPMTSVEGRRLVLQLEKAGYSYEEAIAKASDLFETGTTLPQVNPVEIGDRFYKIMPKGKLPGSQTVFWATKEQVEAMKGQSVDFIGSKFGLPLESQQTLSFDVVEIKAIRPTISFTSRVAPTSQNGWPQSGDASQSLLVDLTAFTSPVKTKLKLP